MGGLTACNFARGGALCRGFVSGGGWGRLSIASLCACSGYLSGVEEKRAKLEWLTQKKPGLYVGKAHAGVEGGHLLPTTCAMCGVHLLPCWSLQAAQVAELSAAPAFSTFIASKIFHPTNPSPTSTVLQLFPLPSNSPTSQALTQDPPHHQLPSTENHGKYTTKSLPSTKPTSSNDLTAIESPCRRRPNGAMGPTRPKTLSHPPNNPRASSRPRLPIPPSPSPWTRLSSRCESTLPPQTIKQLVPALTSRKVTSIATTNSSGSSA